MYDFKTEAREMLPDVTLCDVLNRKIYQKYDDVLLSYGESKKTRSQPIGHLQLGEKRKIVRMIKDREYH